MVFNNAISLGNLDNCFEEEKKTIYIVDLKFDIKLTSKKHIFLEKCSFKNKFVKLFRK